MSNSSDRPIASGRVGIVLEITHDKAMPPAWVGVVLSIPGREGTSRRVWNLVGGHLEPATLDDLEAYLWKSIHDYIVMALPVQGVLW